MQQWSLQPFNWTLTEVYCCFTTKMNNTSQVDVNHIEISLWLMCNAKLVCLKKPVWKSVWPPMGYFSRLFPWLFCEHWRPLHSTEETLRLTKGNGKIFRSPDIAALTLWLTSGGKLFYSGAWVCLYRWLSVGCKSNGAKGMITLKRSNLSPVLTINTPEEVTACADTERGAWRKGKIWARARLRTISHKSTFFYRLILTLNVDYLQVNAYFCKHSLPCV